MDAPASPRPRDEPSGATPTWVGPYLVERRLGQGGFGVTFVASRRFPAGFTKVFCLKQSRDDVAAASEEQLKEGFEREARALTLLDPHPGIVQLVDFFEDEGKPTLVMEYVDGLDLHQLLGFLAARKRLLPTHVATYIAAELASALAFGHSQQIVHRDLKPSNVFIGRFGHVKLGDFGIAKFLGPAGETANHQFRGTTQYASPEHFDPRTIDAQSDLFCLGALLYKMLSGKPPVEARDVPAAYAAITKGQFTPIQQYVPNIDPVLAGLVGRMLQPDKTRRVKTADEVRQALLALPSGADVRESLVQLVKEYRDASVPSGPSTESFVNAMSDVQNALEALEDFDTPGSVSAPQGTLPIGTATLLHSEPPSTHLAKRGGRPLPPPISQPAAATKRRALPLVALGGVALAAIALTAFLSATPPTSSSAPKPAAPPSTQKQDGPTVASATPPPKLPEAPAPTTGSDAAAQVAQHEDAGATGTKEHGRASVDIVAYNFGWVFVDGRELGESPVLGVSLKPGRHSIVIKDAPNQGSILRRESVVLKAGENRLLEYHVTDEP